MNLIITAAALRKRQIDARNEASTRDLVWRRLVFIDQWDTMLHPKAINGRCCVHMHVCESLNLGRIRDSATC
jgi:hypothetical protein